ncbi:MAG TPA: hypothetical protein ENN81_09775 [Phycisphaerales bacterium]|nr:hypothetical protein [Phycisphaerales bacterium]
MIRARDKSVRALTLLVAMCVLFCCAAVVLASGGLAIRKLEHYECEPVCSGPVETFTCGFYGRNRTTITLPGVFLYWKKVRPFGFYLRYQGEPHRYNRITVESIRLATDNGRELTLADDVLPLVRGLDTIHQSRRLPFAFFSHIFDTIVDIPFEDVQSIHYRVQLRLENDSGAGQRLYEGVLAKISIDSVGRCR